MELRHHHLPLLAQGSRAPLADRLAARVKRFGLDRALAGGEDPGSDPLLRCRAEQLGSAKMCRRLAADLRDVVERAEHPAGLSSAAPVAPGAHAVRDTLLGLAARLEAPAPGIRGVAAISLLLGDGASPLWASTTADELEDALEDASIGLGS